MSQSNPELARERNARAVIHVLAVQHFAGGEGQAVGNLNAMTIDRRRSRALLDVAVLYILAEVFESLWVRG